MSDTGTQGAVGALDGAPTTTRFFFYGTLMEGSGALRSVAPRRVGLELVGPAKARALMYAVGAAFPALLEGEGVVHGELWETTDPAIAAEALAVCDAIEGYQERDERYSMYLRRQVTLLEPAVEAFTYFWNGGRSYLSHIPSGDWRRYLSEPHEQLQPVRVTGHRPR